MHGPYPGEVRTRVIDFVEEGGSRREAAEQFDVSVSSAIRWVQRFRENGTFEPMPSGGSSSPLEKHSRQILALISEVSDLTLNEIVSALHKRRIPGSRSALSRFFARHGITIKKKSAGGRAEARRRRPRAPTLTCCGSTVGTHAASAWSAMPRWDTGRR
jgi:transposase